LTQVFFDSTVGVNHYENKDSACTFQFSNEDTIAVFKGIEKNNVKSINIHIFIDSVNKGRYSMNYWAFRKFPLPKWEESFFEGIKF
jgi:hypothetical protein